MNLADTLVNVSADGTAAVLITNLSGITQKLSKGQYVGQAARVDVLEEEAGECDDICQVEAEFVPEVREVSSQLEGEGESDQKTRCLLRLVRLCHGRRGQSCMRCLTTMECSQSMRERGESR